MRQHPASRPKVSKIQFGATVMVEVGQGKRATIAKTSTLYRNNVVKSELGVCLGLDILLFLANMYMQ